MGPKWQKRVRKNVRLVEPNNASEGQYKANVNHAIKRLNMCSCSTLVATKDIKHISFKLVYVTN